MNRIARAAAHLLVATGLATAALTLSTTAARADTPQGPGQIGLAPHTDPDGPVIANPTPDPHPLPAPPKPKKPTTPKGPGTWGNAPHCTHGCGGSEAPKDLADAPDVTPTAEPAADPAQDPARDPANSPQDQGCITGCDLPEEPAAGTTAAVDASADPSASRDAAPAQGAVEPAGSSDLGTGFYVGLGLFSLAAATGIALAARRMVEKRAARA